MVEIEKKLKDEYPKLTLFKVWVRTFFFLNDEKSKIL